jgi:hypothetical protein
MVSTIHTHRKPALRKVAANEDQFIKCDIETWIEALTNTVIGNLVFHLHSPRYLPRAAFASDSYRFSVTLWAMNWEYTYAS